jgi:predicted transcriptional regulator
LRNIEDTHGATFDLGAGKTQNWAGATPLLCAFSRPKYRGAAPARHEGSVTVFWPRAMSRRIQVVLQDLRQNQLGGGTAQHGNHQGTTKQPKSITIQARVEESVKERLDQYAKFIDSTPSYVTAEALKVLFKRDDEFKTWLGQQSNSKNIHELKGGGLKETA